MNSYEMTREFHIAFGLGAPDAPIEPTPEQRILRAKLLLEETLETIQKGLGVDLMFETPSGTEYYLDEDTIQVCITPFRDRGYDPIETLDGCADVKAVTNGLAVLFGLPMPAADREVFESNMSKLDDDGLPIVNLCKELHCMSSIEGSTASDCTIQSHLIDPTQPVGKVLKGPNFRKPNIAGLLSNEAPDVTL